MRHKLYSEDVCRSYDDASCQNCAAQTVKVFTLRLLCDKLLQKKSAQEFPETAVFSVHNKFSKKLSTGSVFLKNRRRFLKKIRDVCRRLSMCAQWAHSGVQTDREDCTWSVTLFPAVGVTVPHELIPWHPSDETKMLLLPGGTCELSLHFMPAARKVAVCTFSLHAPNKTMTKRASKYGF